MGWRQGHKGKKDDFDTDVLNEKISGYRTTTYYLLNELKVKKIESVQEYKTEIRNILKVRLTGKVSRGRVKEQISKLQTYSFEYVLNHKLANEILSVERVRQYKLILEHTKRHFDNKVPTMDVWTEADMISTKRYFIDRKLKPNTLATGLSYIVAIVNYAIKLKIITVNPIPAKS